MNRRDFCKNTALLSTGIAFPAFQILRRRPANTDPIIGHGDFRYKINLDWGAADPARYPVKDCHELAMDKSGRIFMTTNDTRNNILIYNKDGKILDAWGTDYPGAHGLTLHDENGTEYLYIADYERHEVIKTTLDGRVVRIFDYPADAGKYKSKDEFHPTETTVTANGDVFIADGYGLDYVVHYSAVGQLKNTFGGKGEETGNLNNAHGIALDTRDPANPALLVTSRVENALKRFSMDGKHLETIPLPGAFICRPVVQGENIFFAVLISHFPWDSQSGFILILDKNNKVVSAPGGSLPQYPDFSPAKPLYQTVKVFKHPHDVLADQDGNIYVAQWNSGNVYPARLERV